MTQVLFTCGSCREEHLNYLAQGHIAVSIWTQRQSNDKVYALNQEPEDDRKYRMFDQKQMDNVKGGEESDWKNSF